MEESYIGVPTAPWKEKASQDTSEAYEFFCEAKERPDIVLKLYNSNQLEYLEHTKSAEKAWQEVSSLDAQMLKVVKEITPNGWLINTHLQQARFSIDHLWDLPKVRNQTNLRNIQSLGDSVGSYECESIMRVIRFYKAYQELDRATYYQILGSITYKEFMEEE